MSDQQQRPQVSVVPGGQGSPGPIATTDPDGQPPVPEAPPQEQVPQVGGSAFPAPSEAEKAEALGGGLAQQMRARFEAMAATEEFPIPGWENANGEPGLILVARTFGDRKNWGEGLSNEVFIAKSTHKLLYVDDQGGRHEIPGAWGPKLAEMVGVHVSKAADLVALVISKPSPTDPTQRIANVAGIGTLATEIIAWAGRGTRNAEEDLGES